MKPGISSYTYTWAVGVPGFVPDKPLSPSDLIDNAYHKGLSLLQIADNLPIEKLTETEQKDLDRYARDKGVSIEIGGRGLTPDHTMQCLRTAEIMNSTILRMVIDAQGFEPDTTEIISIIRNLIPEFKTRKIKLAIENHDRLKARQFEQIIQSTGSEWVGICLDSVNSMGAGEGFEMVSDILIPYTINLHVKDFAISRVSHKMGLVIEGLPAGKGRLNIPDLIAKLSLTGRCNSAILELWTPPESDLRSTISKEKEWAEESINYLKSIFAKI